MKRLIKRLSCGFLALLVFCSCFGNLFAYAAVKRGTFAGDTQITLQSENSIQDGSSSTLPYTFTATFDNLDLRRIDVCFTNDTVDLSVGDKITYYLVTNSRNKFVSYDKQNVFINAKGVSFNTSNESERKKYIKDYSFTYNEPEGVFVVSFTAIKPLKQIEFELIVGGITLRSAYNYKSANFDVQSFTWRIVNSESVAQEDFYENSSGWFESIFAWFKELVDNVKNGISNIGNWFSDLGDKISDQFSNITDSIKGWFDDVGAWFSDLKNNIKDWFTDVIDNLREWFKNVGDWFSELGKNISDWFSNLWTNISDSITNIKTDISDFWQSIVDWFHDLFVPEDGYFDAYLEKVKTFFSEHFGAIYQSVEMISSFLDSLNDSLSDNSSYKIVSPAIDTGLGVKIPAVNFDISYYLNKYSYINNVYKVYKVGISGLLVFFFILYCRGMFIKIIAKREDF